MVATPKKCKGKESKWFSCFLLFCIKDSHEVHCLSWTGAQCRIKMCSS